MRDMRKVHGEQEEEVRMVSLTVHLDDGTEVHLWPDGQTYIELNAMKVARHELLGYILFRPDGSVVYSRIEDAFVYVPLKERVVTASIRAAWRQVKRARRYAVQISKATGPVRFYEPGTLEHLVLLAEGRIRKDGYPRGYIPVPGDRD